MTLIFITLASTTFSVVLLQPNDSPTDETNISKEKKADRDAMHRVHRKNNRPKTDQTSIQNGFLYPIVNTVLNHAKYFCLVEVYKFIGKKIAGNNNYLAIAYSRTAVDLFIISKWLFIATIWLLEEKAPWLVLIVWYLLVTNLYTYFYYHVWSDDILRDKYYDVDRIKRRFTTLILAISYTIFGFSYLYCVPYSNEFQWKNGHPTFLQSLWFSISNSLTASYDQVKPLTSFAHSVAMVQLLMMFVFLTIIIGGSVPQINQPNKEG